MYDDGKVHPSFNIVGTTSGRISCSEPNLQQLPKAEDEDKYQIRSVFIADVDPVTGKRMRIIAADYDNLEMRVLTYFSKDPLLLEMFEHGHDSHGSTAVNMFALDCSPDECKKKFPLLRQVGKVINFMLMYGGGAMALYGTLKDYGMNLDDKKYLKEYDCKKGVEVAQFFIDKYFDTYKGVSSFLKSQKKFAHRYGFVNTITGRKRRLHNINSSDFKTASYEERLSLNAPIQGTAGDITMNAQNRVEANKKLKELRCEMLIQVHDELVFQCPEENVEEAIEIVRQLMSHPFGDKVELNEPPFTASADSGWSYQEAK
jgi:DNA polymerase-1